MKSQYENWLKLHNNHYYRKFIFYKGSLFITLKIEKALSLASLLSIKTHSRNLMKSNEIS